jgi:hypothetical protein
MEVEEKKKRETRGGNKMELGSADRGGEQDGPNMGMLPPTLTCIFTMGSSNLALVPTPYCCLSLVIRLGQGLGGGAGVVAYFYNPSFSGGRHWVN